MASCPPSETLEQLLAGQLAEPAANSLRAHLPGCSLCQTLLDHLSDDAELRDWRTQARSLRAESATDAALVPLLAGLRMLPLGRPRPDGAVKAGSDLSLFLAPPQQEGDLGSLGPYAVQAELGRGGMGIVLRARDPVLQRTVAVKILRPELDNDETRARFVHEAQAVARVSHDHVVRVFSVANPPNSLPYFTMEYLAGPILAEQIRTQQTLEPRLAAALVAQVAQGLAAAHAAGLIHRDIKPSNILFEPDTGRAKIADFGLARLASQPSGMTQEGMLAGTPTYMSPEQAQGLDTLDGRSDVYSLGATLYEALTGQTPFRGAPHMILQQVVGEEPRPPRQLNDRISRDLETICLKCLRKEPSQRYASALALAEDLHRFLAGAPVYARPVGTLERFIRGCRRKPVLAGLAFSLAVAVVAGSAGVLWQWRRAEANAAQALAKADEARAQSLRARETVDKYLSDVSEDPELKARNLEPLRRKLLRAARDYYEQFVREHPDDPDLQAELGRTYGRLGIIAAILDSPPRSIELFDKKRLVFERLRQSDSGNAAYQSELAESYWRLGYGYHYAGKWPEAWDAFRHARDLWEELVRRYPDEPEYAAHLIRAFNSLGRSYHVAGRIKEGEQVFLEGRAAHARWGEGRPAEGLARYHESLVLLLANLGSLYYNTGRLEEGQESLQVAVTLGERLVKAQPKETAYKEVFCHALVELGNVHYQRAQVDPAEKAWQQAQQVAEEMVQDHPANGEYRDAAAQASSDLATLWYEFRNRHVEAQEVYQRALAIRERLVEEEPRVWPYWANLAGTTHELVALLQGTGQWRAALELSTRLINRWQSASRPEQFDERFEAGLGRLYADRAFTLSHQKRYTEALKDCDQAIRLSSGVYRQEYQHLRALTEGHALVEKGDHARAAEAAKAVAAEPARDGRQLYLVAGLLSRCAAAAHRHDRMSEQCAASAVELLRQARAFGYFRQPIRVEQLDKDEELQPLRGRPDFQKLLAEVRSTAPAGGEAVTAPAEEEKKRKGDYQGAARSMAPGEHINWDCGVCSPNQHSTPASGVGAGTCSHPGPVW